MADLRFVGKWKSDTMENFDDYMKALDVNLVLRKAGQFSTTVMDISREDDLWIWKYKIAFKSGELRFHLGEEFDETTPDGRKVKSTFTMDGETLVHLQVGKPVNSTISRTISTDGSTMTEIATARDVVCTRTYKKIES